MNFKFLKASFSSTTTIQSSGSPSKYLPSRNLKLRRLPPPWIASPQVRTNMTRYAFSPSTTAACARFSSEKPLPTRKPRWRRNLTTRTPPSQTTSTWPLVQELAASSRRCSSPPKPLPPDFLRWRHVVVSGRERKQILPRGRRRKQSQVLEEVTFWWRFRLGVVGDGGFGESGEGSVHSREWRWEFDSKGHSKTDFDSVLWLIEYSAIFVLTCGHVENG